MSLWLCTSAHVKKCHIRPLEKFCDHLHVWSFRIFTWTFSTKNKKNNDKLFCLISISSSMVSLFIELMLSEMSRTWRFCTETSRNAIKRIWQTDNIAHRNRQQQDTIFWYQCLLQLLLTISNFSKSFEITTLPQVV